MTTWAEDRATVGTDLSADPGAKTEGRAADLRIDRPSLPASGLAPGDKSLAAQPRAVSYSQLGKWPEFPEQSGHIFRNAQPFFCWSGCTCIPLGGSCWEI